MKLYFFYHLIDGLEPTLTAFTKNKEKAKLYRKIRKGFYYKEVDGTEEDYNNLIVNHYDLSIELQNFRTSSGFKKFSVILPATVYEIKEIIFHKDDLVLSELQKYIIPIDLFTKPIQKQLHILGYREAEIFMENPNPDCNYFQNEHLKDFEVDELGLFVCLHKDTINEKAIEYEDFPMNE